MTNRGNGAPGRGSDRRDGAGRARRDAASSDRVRGQGSRSSGADRQASKGSGSGGDRRRTEDRSDKSRGAAADRHPTGAAAPAPERKRWAAEGDLPRWIQEEVGRVTPKARIQPTLELLQTAAKAFAGGKHGKALHLLEEAKELSPRTATIRELLGLSAYRLGRWEVALRELRTFRRLTGESTHMPVEMDVLRALDRPADVDEVWEAFRRIGGERETEREARVVYGSHLLDVGKDREAWELTNPRRIGESPQESELRVWFVAARAAARLGDRRTGRRIYEAIQAAAPGFPGLDELDRATAAAS